MLRVSTSFCYKDRVMRTPRSYHHGNLKQALLEASLDLIRKAGPGAFTLREVARRAGVSHNAPYRHFRDKEELLAALAAEGFDRLTAAMTKAAESASGALERFRSSGRGYVEFALRYPQHFAVMFEVPWQYRVVSGKHRRRARALSELWFATSRSARRSRFCRRETRDHSPCSRGRWSTAWPSSPSADGFPCRQPADVLRFTDTATGALWRGLAHAFAPGP